ncbi:MAG: hypothetical protein IJ365_07905, partial [Clostridia bacterium]|nr:hypothetical protein [Clostridia bacterium]
QFYQHQAEFNYVPYSALDKAKLCGDRVQLGDNKYRYVFGDTQGLKLSAKSISCYDEITDRVFETAKECPDLRVTSFTKDGIHCFFLVNAGEHAIHEDVLIKSDCAILAVDLWNGTTQRAVTQRQEDRQRLGISLSFRESVLLIEADPQKCDVMKYAEPAAKQYADIEFVQSGAESDKLKKYYISELDLSQVEQNLYLKVWAEEMAECCVNGHFAGVSFWNEHEFYLTPYLKKGKNRIELCVTGTLANIYSAETIDYGLTITQGDMI